MDKELIQTDISAGKVAYQTEQGFIKVRGIISGFDFNSFEVIFLMEEKQNMISQMESTTISHK